MITQIWYHVGVVKNAARLDRAFGVGCYRQRVEEPRARHGVPWLLLSSIIFCGCDRRSDPPRVPQIGGPAVARPLPKDPALRRLAALGAEVYENQPVPPGMSCNGVGYEGKCVEATMLSPLHLVPRTVVVRFHDCTILPGALAELDGMPSLDALRFSTMRLSDESLSEITSLPGLLVLGLDKVDGVTGRGLGFLSSCTKLSLVDLRNTPIESEALDALANHPRLKSLHLDGTQVGDDGLHDLTGLPLLSVLSLNGARITDHGLSAFAQLTALKSLDVKDTRITDAGLIHLLGCKKLTVLALDGTDVTDEGMSQLARLPALVVLELNDTAVTDAGMAKLAASTTLRSVEARGTQVTKAARKLLPKVETLYFNGSHDSSYKPVP